MITTRTLASKLRKLSVVQFSNPAAATALAKELTPNQHFTFSSFGNFDNDNGRMIFEESNDVQMSDAKRRRNDGDEEDVESEKDEVGYL